MRRFSLVLRSALVVMLIASPSFAQKKKKQAKAAAPATAPVRGSIVEDRAARKLVQAGDSRYDADEAKKAVEIWQSVIERYPRSKVRYEAHMKLGTYMLDRERAYDRARKHFEEIASEENTNDDQRVEGLLKTGVCWYHGRNYGKCFKIMREIIEKYPVSSQVNNAYYYIGLGHFKLGHYSRAIQALEKVGTALNKSDAGFDKVEAGKRLFLKIEDADLAVLTPDQTVKVMCRATSGDEEVVDCISVGRRVRLVLGSILTQLGKPRKGNGTLEVKGDDKVEVTYIDSHTADKSFDRPVIKRIMVVGNAVVQITDGAFADSVKGAVLGKDVNLQVLDADRDLTDEADKLKAVVEIYREKTDDEVESEIADILAKGTAGTDVELDEDGKPKVDRFKVVDKVEVVLNEAKIEKKNVELNTGEGEAPAEPQVAPATPDGAEPTTPDLPTPGTPAPGTEPKAGDDPAKSDVDDLLAEVKKEAVDNSIHSGTFRITVPLAKSEEINTKDDILQAQPGDFVQLSYLDKLNSTDDEKLFKTRARAVEGNLGGVRVTRTEISDQELKLRTELKTAGALANIGNRYKEFGLKTNAMAKYKQAQMVCDEIMKDARRLGGKILEETYVQLWKIYFEMDRYELASAMAQRLQKEFPDSGFVDDAMLQLADISRKRGDLRRAIGLYSRLVRLKDSQLRGEGQFGIAECYEQMAKAANENARAALYDRAFQEYKKVFDQFPESGRVGEAVSKMANFYYQKKDYSRAIDIFETVLADHPDAKFLDVILFNYGRCLYRMDRKREARQQFDQLIADFPESALAKDAKRIAEALAKGGF